MLEVIQEKRFKKDIEKAKKSDFYTKQDFLLFKLIIQKLLSGEEIQVIYKRHKLKGELKKYECIHIKNDWLLLFKIENNTLHLSEIGKHSKVYKKM